MANNQRNPKYDPLDPFYSEEIDYETSGIRRSKANQLKRATSKPASAPTVHEKKKVSFFSRIKTFFEELPNRADRYRIYRMAVIIFASVVGTFLLLLLIVFPNIAAEIQISDKNNALLLYSEVNGFILNKNSMDVMEYRNRLNDYISIVHERIENANTSSDQYATYITTLSLIYREQNEIDRALQIIVDSLDNRNLSAEARVQLLLAKKNISKEFKYKDKYIESLESLLNYDKESLEIVNENRWNEIYDSLVEEYNNKDNWGESDE